MSSSFPQEIFDLIIDHLSDEPTTLKACCIVCKAWVWRTRKHLFYYIKFPPRSRLVRRWKETFPDLLDSPAHHTRALYIRYSGLDAIPDVDTLTNFHDVVHLKLNTGLWLEDQLSLVPLHGFSPVVRSLHLTFSFLSDSKIFNLIHSFPLLEDLAMVSSARRIVDEAWNGPSTSPKLTGSLELYLRRGIQSIARGLSDLPGGPHFEKITVSWFGPEDVWPTMNLVSKCSGTLQSLAITNHIIGGSFQPLIDLSKTTRLEDVAFRFEGSGAQWATATLRTANPESLKQVSLELPYGAYWQEDDHREWWGLDSLLVQFWKSHSLHLKVTHELVDESDGWVARLLPQLTGGIAQVANYTNDQRTFLNGSIGAG